MNNYKFRKTSEIVSEPFKIQKMRFPNQTIHIGITIIQHIIFHRNRNSSSGSIGGVIPSLIITIFLSTPTLYQDFRLLPILLLMLIYLIKPHLPFKGTAYHSLLLMSFFVFFLSSLCRPVKSKPLPPSGRFVADGIGKIAVWSGHKALKASWAAAFDTVELMN